MKSQRILGVVLFLAGINSAVGQNGIASASPSKQHTFTADADGQLLRTASHY